MEYVIRMEPGVQDPEETLGKARGSCRDSADVAPIKGVIPGGGGHTVEVAVDAEAIDEAAEPRG